MTYQETIKSIKRFPTLTDGEGFTFKDTLTKYLFWDTDHTTIDLEKHRKYVIERVLERSYDWLQFQLMIQHYGRTVVIETIKEIYYLTNETITFCHIYFDIPKEEMLSYRRKKELPNTWM